MRMEMTSFAEVLFNPVAQVKFVHTTSAGYVTGAMFVLGISSYYMLKKRDLPFARRSFAIASSFGFAAILSVIILGDESGYEIGDVQKTKLAAIEAEWETQEAPADFTLIGFPSQDDMETHGAIKIPGVLGLIATRSLDEEVVGIKDLLAEHEERIHRGMEAYGLLEKMRAGDKSEPTVAAFDALKDDLGYGLLLKKYTENVVDATDEQIKMAAKDSIPQVAPMFWSFRIMVAIGFLMLLMIATSFWSSIRHNMEQKPWLLKAHLWAIPLPFLACETGWFVAEFGRQPWAIGEVLPTHLAVSSLTMTDLFLSLGSFIALYSLLLVAEIYLMFKFGRMGPSALHTGRYHHEQNASGASAAPAQAVKDPA